MIMISNRDGWKKSYMYYLTDTVRNEILQCLSYGRRAEGPPYQMMDIAVYVSSGIVAIIILGTLLMGTLSIGHGIYLISRHKGTKYAMDMENLILHTMAILPSMGTLIIDMVVIALSTTIAITDSTIVDDIRTIVLSLGYGTIITMVATNLFYHTKMTLNIKYPDDKDTMDLVIAVCYLMSITTVAVPIIVVSVIGVIGGADTIMVVIYFIVLVTVNGAMAIAMVIVGIILISVVFSRIYRLPGSKDKKVPTLIREIAISSDSATIRIRDSITRIFLVLIVMGTLVMVRTAIIIVSYATPYTYIMDNIGIIVDITMAIINCLCYGIFLRYRFSNIIHMIVSKLS